MRWVFPGPILLRRGSHLAVLNSRAWAVLAQHGEAMEGRRRRERGGCRQRRPQCGAPNVGHPDRAGCPVCRATRSLPSAARTWQP